MKRTGISLLLMLFALCVSLSVIFLMPAAASDNASAEGMSFSKTDYFVQEEAIESISGNLTLEAEIWMDPSGSYGSNKAYVVFGSYADSRGDGFNLLIRSPSTSSADKNKLLVEIYDRRVVNGSNKNTTIKFTGIDLKKCFGTKDNPTYCKILVTIDVASKSSTLYLSYKDESGKDMTYTETVVPSSWYATAFSGSDYPMIIGGDQRTGNTAYFLGKTKNVAMYSGISKTAGTTEGINAMFKYDLTDTSVEGYLADLSGNSNDAMHPTLFDESLKYDYSFAIVGDTQYMTKWDVIKRNGVVSSTEHLKKVYDWILENKEKKNIQYVMGLGDITDSYDKSYDKQNEDTAAEWAWAYSQISRLDGNIPYSVVRGNHDNETYFDSYFVNESYQNQFNDPDGYSCFFSEDSVRNAYTKFEVGTEKYLLLLLDDNPTDPVLEWANEVVKRNPDYRVIINTHTYLAYTGDHVDNSATYEYATMNLYEGENNGVQIWEKLVSKHENIVLVLCGHDQKCSGEIIRTVRIGDNGNAVNEVLVCPQSLDGNEARETKAGMVAMLYFSNGGKDVRVEYVSTALTYESDSGKDVYHKEEVNNIRFSLMTLPTKTEHGYIHEEYLDVDKYPVAVFSDTGVFLGAYDSIFDITNPYNDSGAIYKAKTTLDVNSWNGTSFDNDPKGVTIVLRKNYSFKSNESYNNTSFIKGVITIDLNGFTLTANDAKSPFSATVKPLNSTTTIPTEINIINGTVEMGAKPLITLAASGGSNNLDISKKPFTWSFDNVYFKASEKTSDAFVTYTSEYEANPTLIFNDCVFDMSNAPENTIMFDLGNGYINATVKVCGGNIISNAGADFVLYKNAKAEDRLVFAKGEDGSYTTLTVPKGTELPTVAVNGGALTFVKDSEAGDYEIYKLASTLDFTPKTSITLSNALVYNVYIPTSTALKSFTLDGVLYTDLASLANTVTLHDGKDYYHFEIELPSAEAARSIMLTAVLTVDGKDYSGSFTMSIPKYAAKVIEEGTEVEKALAKDVLAYVQAAYNYFADYNTEEEIERVNAIVNELLALGGDYIGEPTISGETAKDNAGIVTDVTLNLDSKPTIRFYVTDTNVSFYLDGKKLNTVSGVDEKYGAYVELDVYAYALAETITFGDGGSYHISDFLTKSAGADHENLVACFVKYVESAAAYRISVVNK